MVAFFMLLLKFMACAVPKLSMTTCATHILVVMFVTVPSGRRARALRCISTMFAVAVDDGGRRLGLKLKRSFLLR